MKRFIEVEAHYLNEAGSNKGLVPMTLNLDHVVTACHYEFALNSTLVHLLTGAKLIVHLPYTIFLKNIQDS